MKFDFDMKHSSNNLSKHIHTSHFSKNMEELKSDLGENFTMKIFKENRLMASLLEILLANHATNQSGWLIN